MELLRNGKVDDYYEIDIEKGTPGTNFLPENFGLRMEAEVEEMMDYRTYCETMAGLLRKPIVKLLRNLKVSRNVKWIYQEGISISGRCFLACFNGKLQ